MGTPDLQGVWVNDRTPRRSNAPRIRRPRHVDRRGGSRSGSAPNRIFKDGKGDFALGDDVFFAALRDQQEYRNAASTVNSLDNVDKVFDNRTSLITNSCRTGGCRR